MVSTMGREYMACYNAGFLLHALIEVPACLNFFLFPSGQLGTPTPQAHAVVRQYAVLILSSILVAMSFVRRPRDEVSARVAGALAVYHLAPSIRSASRLRRQAQSGERLVPSEAFVYLMAHVICGSLLSHHWGAFYLNMHPPS